MVVRESRPPWVEVRRFDDHATGGRNDWSDAGGASWRVAWHRVPTRSRLGGNGTEADGDGVLGGLVTDEKLAPIPGAVVTVEDTANATTDEVGCFTLGGLAPSTHGVIVQALGYRSQAKSVDITSRGIIPGRGWV